MQPKKSEGAAFSLPSDTEIVVTRSFDAPRALVYETWTNTKHIPRWMTGPEGWKMTVCEVDLRPGGLSRFAWESPDGQSMEMIGEYVDVVPLERVVKTQGMGDGSKATTTFEFAEDGGRTTVTVTLGYPTKAARDAALQSGLIDGMESGFKRVEAVATTL